MGCCQTHMPNIYIFSPKQTVHYHSILLKEKKNSGIKKSVRFEFSYTKFRHLSITEETETPQTNIFSDSHKSFKDYKKTENIQISYLIEEKKIKTELKIEFTESIKHEAIICLVNDPKFRVLWDTDIKKIDIVFGDPYLDGAISIERVSGDIKVWFRKVRTFNNDLYIIYTPFGDDNKDKTFEIKLVDNRRLVAYIIEDLDQDFDKVIQNNYRWGQRLYEEVISHTKCDCNLNPKIVW